MNISTGSRSPFLLLAIFLLCFCLGSGFAFGQGGTGGNTGGTGGNTGGSGGSTGGGGNTGGGGGNLPSDDNADAYYTGNLFSRGVSFPPPGTSHETNLPDGLDYTITLDNFPDGGFERVKYKVLVTSDPANGGDGDPMVLSPNEIIRVDFEVTLEDYEYKDANGNVQFPKIAHDFFPEEPSDVSGFVLLDGPGDQSNLNQEFAKVGDTHTGWARLQFTGDSSANGVKHFFSIRCESNNSQTTNVVESAWCSRVPEPLTTTLPRMAGCESGNCDETVPGKSAVRLHRDIFGPPLVTNLSASDGGGVAGCSSCVGGGGGSGTQLMSLTLGQAFTPSNQHSVGSHSPGVFAKGLDYPFEVFGVCSPKFDSYYVIAFTNPVTQETFLFHNPDQSPNFVRREHHTGDHTGQRKIKPFTIVDAAGNPATDITILTDLFATLEDRDGMKYKYKIVNTNFDADSPEQYKAQLVSIMDRRGLGLSFAYKSFSQSQIEASPDIQLQIDTITDAYGVVANVTYAAAQVSGRFVWEKVVVNNYTDQPVEMTYEYSSMQPVIDHLSSVKRDGVVVAEYSYDSGTYHSAIIFEDKLNPTPAGKGTILVSPDYRDWEGDVANQYAGVIQVRKDGSDYQYMQFIQHQTEPSRFLIQYRGLYMHYVHGQSLQYLVSDPDPNSGNWSFTDGFDGFDPDDHEEYYARNVSTPEEAAVCLNPTTIDETGYILEHQYDAEGNVIETMYQDGSIETWTYNLYNQPLTFTDRAGYLTEYEYDTFGNLKRRSQAVGTDSELHDMYGYDAAGLLSWSGRSGGATTPSPNARTDYDYYANNRLKKVTKPLPHGQSTRPTVQYTWQGARIDTVTNERGKNVMYQYETPGFGMGRVVVVSYEDTTSEQTYYHDAARTVYRKDRNGVVSKSVRDTACRMRFEFNGFGHDANLHDGTPGGAPNIDTVHPADQYTRTNYVYTNGWTTPGYKTTNSTPVSTLFDYRGRPRKVTSYPVLGGFRYTDYVYEKNLLFRTQERFPGYVRRTFNGYTEDRLLARRIRTRVGSIGFANNAAVINYDRTTISPNAVKPNLVVYDAYRDVRGNIIKVTDPRGTDAVSVYNGLAQVKEQTRAFGTTSELTTTYKYDDRGNRFEMTDPAGAVTRSVFDDANNVISTTRGFGTDLALTTTFEYDADGTQSKTTSPSGAVRQTFRNDCCGRSIGVRDGLGHGQITNQDAGGRSVHTAIVEDYDDHIDLLNPVDSKTLSETTTRYFDSGQAQYKTVWKSALGSIDRANPPIAGIDGVSAADGVTTQFAYDYLLGNGQGLESPGGIAVELLGGGSANISISAAVAKLAQPVASGGAGISFSHSRAGSASLSISADEKTMQITINDGKGRSVMQAQMYGPKSSSPNTLIDWTCTLREKTYPLAGFSTTESTWQIDPDGEHTESLIDGYGNSVGSVDQLGNVTKTWNGVGGQPRHSYDAKGNRTIYIYDVLGRRTQARDPLGNLVQTRYDAAGRMNRTIDAKGKAAWTYYDVLSRVIRNRDRNAKNTWRTYDFAGRLETIKDAENWITTYVYNVLGRRTVTTLADGGAKTTDYDAAGRVIQVDLASGKTQKTFYKFSGVIDKVEYHDDAGVLTGKDTFFHDQFLRRSGSTSRDGVIRALTYNERGQLDTDTTTFGQSYVVEYDYDDRGRLEEITYPSGRKAGYGFDERGLLKTISWEGVVVETRLYDEAGLLTNVNRAAVNEERDYDDANRLKSIFNTNVGKADYAYDENGNKLSETWDGVMAAWNFTTVNGSDSGYDHEDRFMNFNQPGQSSTIAMTRSAIGNIDNINENGSNTGRAYTSTHELETVGSAIQTFDDDGNVEVAYSGIEHDWDGAGMLEKTTVEAGDTAGIEGINEYGYDASQKRVNKKITRDGTVVEDTIYIYARDNCIAEYAKGTAPPTPNQEYVYGNEIDSLVMVIRNAGAQLLAVTRNQQWSVTALCDYSTGDVLERYSYGIFGERTVLGPNGTDLRESSAYVNPYGYTSRRHDQESGLMHFRARYFDSGTGDFVSRDPMEYVDGMSLFSGYFVLFGVDPLGKEKILARVTKPTIKEGGCGVKRQVSWNFVIPRKHGFKKGEKGWLVQKVTVRCGVSKCTKTKDYIEKSTCGTIVHPGSCQCNFMRKNEFVYYEAWRIGLKERQPVSPNDHDDTAWATPKDNRCGEYIQKGDLRLYKDSQTGDLRKKWTTGQTFGKDSGCGTTSGFLLGFDGKAGPPEFWKDEETQHSGNRRFELSWKCCDCLDRKSKSVVMDFTNDTRGRGRK